MGAGRQFADHDGPAHRFDDTLPQGFRLDGLDTRDVHWFYAYHSLRLSTPLCTRFNVAHRAYRTADDCRQYTLLGAAPRPARVSHQARRGRRGAPDRARLQPGTGGAGALEPAPAGRTF